MSISMMALDELDRRIIFYLSAHGPSVRSALCRALSTPRTTMYDHLVKLMAANIISKTVEHHPVRGRPQVRFGLKTPQLRYTLVNGQGRHIKLSSFELWQHLSRAMGTRPQARLTLYLLDLPDYLQEILIYSLSPSHYDNTHLTTTIADFYQLLDNYHEARFLSPTDVATTTTTTPSTFLLGGLL